MPADIYDQHRAAFARISAYVVVNKSGDLIATVAFKTAKNGERRTCYLHVQGAQMVRAYAGGGGYDRRSAAMHKALSRVEAHEGDIRTIQRVGAMRDAVTDNGAHWDQDLRRVGFTVHQAV